jgi:tetratricopeptide (TPR) repeat protein
MCGVTLLILGGHFASNLLEYAYVRSCGQTRTVWVLQTERSGAGAPLNGWRSISAYLACDQSTAKRWAATRNLPVYRPAGSQARKGVPVYAFADELDLWLKGHAAEPHAAEPEPVEASAPLPHEPVAPQSPPKRRLLSRMRLGYAALLMVLVLAVGGGVLVVVWRSEGVASTPDPYAGVPAQARQLYLDAYYLWQQRTPDTLTEAQGLLTQALALAPRFARAEADLASVYNLMVEYDVMQPAVGYDLSRKAAEKAIEYDPTIAQPYSVLGDIVFFWDRNYAAGLDHLRRAVDLDGRDVLAQHWYASALGGAGRFEEAEKHIAVARELEPLSRSIIVSEAMIRLGLGQASRAREMLAKLVEAEPDYRSPYRFLAFAELALGDDRAYLAALHRRFSLVGDLAANDIVTAGERALQAEGHDGMVRALLASTGENADLVKDPSVVAHFLALGGDWKGAVQWLVRTPSRRFSYYGIDPAYDAAKQNPAFREAILEAGIPAIW